MIRDCCIFGTFEFTLPLGGRPIPLASGLSVTSESGTLLSASSSSFFKRFEDFKLFQ